MTAARFLPQLWYEISKPSFIGSCCLKCLYMYNVKLYVCIYVSVWNKLKKGSSHSYIMILFLHFVWRVQQCSCMWLLTVMENFILQLTFGFGYVPFLTLPTQWPISEVAVLKSNYEVLKTNRSFAPLSIYTIVKVGLAHAYLEDWCIHTQIVLRCNQCRR